MRDLLHNGAARLLNAMLHWPGASYPWGFLFWVSLAITVVALVVFRFTVSPFRIARARNRALANLLELRLYQHDVAAMPAILGRALADTARYLIGWLPPLVVLGILLWPLFPYVVELSKFRAFRPGDLAIVRGVVRDIADLDSATLEGADSSLLEPLDAPFRSIADREITWRFRVRAPGRITLRWVVSGETADLPLIIGNEFAHLVRERWGVDQRDVGCPVLRTPLPATSRWAAIRIDYPRREWQIGRVRISWMLACFMLCITMGWMLKSAFGVEF